MSRRMEHLLLQTACSSVERSGHSSRLSHTYLLNYLLTYLQYVVSNTRSFHRNDLLATERKDSTLLLDGKSKYQYIPAVFTSHRNSLSSLNYGMQSTASKFLQLISGTSKITCHCAGNLLWAVVLLVCNEGWVRNGCGTGMPAVCLVCLRPSVCLGLAVCLSLAAPWILQLEVQIIQLYPKYFLCLNKNDEKFLLKDPYASVQILQLTQQKTFISPAICVFPVNEFICKIYVFLNLYILTLFRLC
jgi:hypothetical protein